VIATAETDPDGMGSPTVIPGLGMPAPWHSSRRGSGGRTREQLYQEARAKGVKGRSKMSKAELERAVGR
jgi:hypothetical protein